jgi:hypothetical protein
MRALGRYAAAIAVALLLPSVAYAQASIAGVVKDTSGAVLPGVTVEAASPVLIEKVRTAVTDGNGRFQITELRPGAYTVTFTLTGFNTVKRDGITLSGSAIATVDADLRVGALEETITVTGEAPTVDVQSTTRQAVLDNDSIQALPTTRNYATLARMIPGTNSNVNDVGGGAIQDVGGSTTIHGSRNTDQRVTLNGINTMTLQAGGNIGGQIPDVGSAAEITIDTSSLSAELPTGGVRINFIPKDGGNTFTSATFLTFSNSSLQGDNFSDALRASGLTTPNKVLKNFDINESIGGPFKRDKVWFWFSTRYNMADAQAAVLQNKNAYNPDPAALYVPDPDNPGVNKGRVQQNSIRVTWQASPKNKIAGTYKVDKWCNCPNNISATVSPEAGRDRRFPRLRQEHLEWTSPVTNRLLLEAVGMHLFERWGNMHMRINDGSLTSPAQEAALPQMISTQEQTTGMTYRAMQTFNNTLVPNFAYRAAASYVTGTHNMKVGFNRTHGFQITRTYQFQPYQYRFNNGVPNQVTIFATPYSVENHEDNDLGLYAQDRWTLNRMTVGLALRYDHFGTSFPEQHLGPGLLVPNRDLTFPAQDNTAWNDLTYRTGFSYDVFGTGKTAIKVAANKYLLGQTLNALGGGDTNPINAMVTSTNRSWNDRGGLGINNDYIPQCNLTNPAANGECGPMANPNFGTAVPGATFDKDLMTGWGTRASNWEFSAGVQHELLPRISVDAAYFRRIWQNFRVTDNLALSPADFDRFSITAPTDSRLPGGGGYKIDGLYDVKPEAFTRPARNLNTLSDKYGKQIEHWDGFDITVNARLQSGLTMQAGTSTGRSLFDNCEVVAKLPELNLATANVTTFPVTSTNVWQPGQFCHQQSPWQTQMKAYGVYTLPKVDVQVAGTFRSTPGAPINANFVATNAFLATNSTLGRPLAGGAANLTVGLLSPEQTNDYIERRNELDLRFGKVLRFGRYRSVISLDVFNALNSDALISINQSFASWLRPTEILNARLMKVTWNLNF